MAETNLRIVLIVEDEASICNVLDVLKAALTCADRFARPEGHPPDMPPRESFDSVLLDLRCAASRPQQIAAPLLSLRPRLLERVLVITGETSDPEFLEWVAEICLPHACIEPLVQDLTSRIRRLLGPLDVPKPAS